MKPGRPSIYTAEEDAVLIEHYIQSGAAWCARRLARPIEQIWNRAHRLGLSRPRGPQRHAQHHERPAHYDHRALARALGSPRLPPAAPAAARVHRIGERI
jgi:hypothetical protein